MDIPSSKSASLQDFLSSLKRRRKSLKFQTSKMYCERVLERGTDGEIEKVEVELESKVTTERRLTRVSVWEDNWIWVWTGSMEKKKWVWEYETEGRLLGEFSGRDIVGAIEKTHALSADDSELRFSEFWREKLAAGPKLVT